MASFDIDAELERLRETHRARSRYTVYRSETSPRRNVDLTPDLTWNEAKWMVEKLDLESAVEHPQATSWTRPLHFSRLQPQT